MNLFNLFRHPAHLKDLSPTQVHELIHQNPSPAIIDVRTTLEYRGGHIGGAVSYPLGREGDIISTYSKGSKIILICRTGHRSQAAAIELLKVGFTNVSHLQGGMNAWHRERRPVQSN
jgi:rhodanese-related sulfurtransferase